MMTTTPKTLNVTECHQLLDALLCKNGTKKQFRKGIRNYAMGLLMLDAGLRVGEVVQLLISDLHYGAGPVESLTIRPEIAKNKTERIIPLSERIRNAIVTLSDKVWKPLVFDFYGFALRNHTTGQSLTTRQVERIVRKAALKSIGRPVHPHILRHTFATRLMRKTNARVVQELLGHKYMTSTQIYTHPNQDDLKRAIDQLGQGEIETGLPPMGSSPE